jgi:hypothetical protein
MTKAHTSQRPVIVDYIAITLATLLWFSFLLSGTPYMPSSLFQNFRNRFTTRGQWSARDQRCRIATA